MKHAPHQRARTAVRTKAAHLELRLEDT